MRLGGVRSRREVVEEFDHELGHLSRRIEGVEAAAKVSDKSRRDLTPVHLTDDGVGDVAEERIVDDALTAGEVAEKKGEVVEAERAVGEEIQAGVVDTNTDY